MRNLVLWIEHNDFWLLEYMLLPPDYISFSREKMCQNRIVVKKKDVKRKYYISISWKRMEMNLPMITESPLHLEIPFRPLKVKFRNMKKKLSLPFRVFTSLYPLFWKMYIKMFSFNLTFFYLLHKFNWRLKPCAFLSLF